MPLSGARFRPGVITRWRPLWKKKQTLSHKAYRFTEPERPVYGTLLDKTIHRFFASTPPPPTDKQTNTRTSSLCYCCPLCPLVIDLITAHQKHRYDYTAKQTTTWRRHNKLQRSDSELRKKTRPVMYGVTGGGGGRRQGDVSGRLGSCRGHRG